MESLNSTQFILWGAQMLFYISWKLSHYNVGILVYEWMSSLMLVLEETKSESHNIRIYPLGTMHTHSLLAIMDWFIVSKTDI